MLLFILQKQLVKQKLTTFEQIEILLHSRFNPPYIDVAELKKDLDAYFQLKPFDTLAKQLSDEFSDTVMMAGSEAYSVALVYYNTVKMGARMNGPGAKAIYEELRKRFEGQGKSKSSDQE